MRAVGGEIGHALLPVVQDYHLTDEDDDSQASSAAQHSTSGGSDVSQRDMGLQYLGLKPEDVVANVCLLGVMPDFRRSGMSIQARGGVC
jgi:hypothetical protein